LDSVGLTATAQKYVYITACTEQVHIFKILLPIITHFTGDIVQNFVGMFVILGYDFLKYCTVWTKLKICVYSCNIIPNISLPEVR
jgi:hypothetical protein